MEIFGFIAIILIYVFFGQIIRAFFSSLSAGWRTIIHGGTFAENFKTNFIGMGEFELKGEINSPSDETPFEVLELKGKGLVPIGRQTDISFVTSILDTTNEQPMPVLSALDAFQEPTSRAFHHIIQAGQVSPNEGYINWVRVGAVIPDILIPPYAGHRNLAVVTRIIDSNNPPPIEIGFTDKNHPGMIATFIYEFDRSFSDIGYQEEAANSVETSKLIIMLGVQVAMADGDFADAEGNIIKDWIASSVGVVSDDRQSKLKIIYNKSFKDGYEKALNGTLSISKITETLNEIASKSQKYEALELCLDVMAADGVAEEEELTVIKNISESLNLDFQEIQKMKDQRIIKLSTKTSSQSSIEAMLDINPDWSTEEINKHLRGQFTKWNGRLNTLNDGEERENAQRMLDIIAEARKKYAARS